jgi:Zn-dependent protease
MSIDALLLTIYLAVGVLISLLFHEYAHAFVAARLGDVTPRQSGRLTLNPGPHVDTFGTLILPGILLLPVPFGSLLFPVFAYANPQPLSPWNVRIRGRDSTLIALAGPAANLLLAFVFGGLVRVAGQVQLARFLAACLFTTVVMAVMQIVPLPGLDGSRVLARFLPPKAQEVYTNLAQYLPLWILLVFFIFPGPIFAFVGVVGDGICRVAAGTNCIEALRATI